MRNAQKAWIMISLFPALASAAVFQYAVPVATPRGESAAFLWIPPEAARVRGVLMGGMTLMERECVKDERIRQACAAEGLAIVFLKCGLGSADLQKVLDDLARASGYGELSAAPLMFIGHSAGGPQAKSCAARMAGRCFGLVLYRGGVPGGADAVPPGVPVLMMVGQFDEFGGTMRDAAGRESWEGARDAVAAFRAESERHLASIVVEPGAGHFAWSDRNAAYLALFIRKAAQARIPPAPSIDARGSGALKEPRAKEEPAGGKERPGSNDRSGCTDNGNSGDDSGSRDFGAPPEPIALNEIDHRNGWLSDLTIKAKGELEPAPWHEYRGDKARAAWHFDEEMAEATALYHAGGSDFPAAASLQNAQKLRMERCGREPAFSKKDQFIRWQDPCWVDAGTRFFFTRIQWVQDGQTFEVHPVYADVYPSTQADGRGPRWLQAGQPVGRSSAPIRVRQVSGPVVAVGPSMLRMQHDGLAPATEGARVTFMAFSPGDAEYRHTELVGMMPRGFDGLKAGKEQAITFPPIGNLKADCGPVELNATSDSGLPVEYYVAHGPAAIVDRKLRIEQVPARATFPIALKVVAWQFGRGVEPLVRTARPAEQTIQIEKP